MRKGQKIVIALVILVLLAAGAYFLFKGAQSTASKVKAKKRANGTGPWVEPNGWSQAHWNEIAGSFKNDVYAATRNPMPSVASVQAQIAAGTVLGMQPVVIGNGNQSAAIQQNMLLLQTAGLTPAEVTQVISKSVSPALLTKLVDISYNQWATLVQQHWDSFSESMFAFLRVFDINPTPNNIKLFAPEISFWIWNEGNGGPDRNAFAIGSGL